MTVDGLLRGAGDMTMFTIANLVNLFIRVAVAMTMAPVYGIHMVWVAVPIGWFMNWLISYCEYRTGKWKKNLRIPGRRCLPKSGDLTDSRLLFQENGAEFCICPVFL